MGQGVITGRNFPFRRNTAVSPIMVPAADEASQVAVGPLPQGVTSFGMVNSYPVFIRLLGSNEQTGFRPANEADGWLVPPYHFGIYSTQYPKWLSCIAVDRPGFPLRGEGGALLYPQATLEIFYGSGV